MQTAEDSDTPISYASIQTDEGKKLAAIHQILQYQWKSDLMDHILIWEDLVRVYERSLNGDELDSAVKIASVVNGSKDRLRDQLIARNFTDYDALRRNSSTRARPTLLF